MQDYVLGGKDAAFLPHIQKANSGFPSLLAQVLGGLKGKMPVQQEKVKLN